MTDELTFDEYQRVSSRTIPQTATQRDLLSQGGLGASGELGEVTNLIEKVLHQHHELTPDVVAQLEKELGDAFWYMAEICTAIGSSMGKVASRNVEKLRIRYPNGDGWSLEASLARVDQAEDQADVDYVAEGAAEEFLASHVEFVHVGDDE